MDSATKELVRSRANNRCEYCLLPQEAAPFITFHIEHIIARQHDIASPDDPENLALACPDCNRFKGPNLSTLNVQTGELTPLFNPRTDSWSEHFLMSDSVIFGLTPIGKALPDCSR